MGLFLASGPAVETDDLAFVGDSFVGAAEEFTKGNIGRYGHIFKGRGSGLVHASECSSEKRSFKFDTLVVAQIEEGIAFKEELFEDLVAVLLILIASAHN